MDRTGSAVVFRLPGPRHYPEDNDGNAHREFPRDCALLGKGVHGDLITIDISRVFIA